MTSLTKRRSAACVAALAVAVGGFTVSGAAVAATPSAPTVVAPMEPQVPSVIDLDSNRTGSLTIEKRDRTDNNATTNGNGLADPSVSGDLVAGVEFKIERVSSLDLTKQSDWEKLATYDNSVAALRAAETVVDGPANQTTGADGRAVFSDLPLGVYIVTEVSAPSGYTLAEPFVVTVPMTHATDLDKWNYDPLVYPKNAKTTIEKTVSDAQSWATGETISYKLSSDIPNLPGSQTLDYYAIVDEYDSRLTVTAGTVVLSLDSSPEVVLAEGTDYVLSEITTPFDQNGDGDVTTDSVKRLSAVFTEDGRAKILAARRATDATAATKVVMTFDAAVTEDIAANGLVKNTGFVLPNTPSDNWDPATDSTPPPDNPPSSEVVSKYGKVKITKVESTDGAAPLAGAEFQVYKCTGPVSGGASPTPNFTAGDWTLVDTNPLTADLDPVTIVKGQGAGQSTFTTAGDGTVTIDALQNNDWENNAEVPVDQRDWYCLVETKAPEGYELLSTPIAFQILQSNSSEDNQYLLEATVKNVPSNGGFKLPFTGAQGVILLIVIGGVLILGGAGLAIVARRKRQ